MALTCDATRNLNWKLGNPTILLIPFFFFFFFSGLLGLTRSSWNDLDLPLPLFTHPQTDSSRLRARVREKRRVKDHEELKGSDEVYDRLSHLTMTVMVVLLSSP